MSLLDRHVNDLRDLVEDILYQFRLVDAAAANGPHAELSCKELGVVEYLGDSGPRMMRELAEFLLLAVNSVTSTVDNLEDKGIVRRQRSEEDRRVVRVELTDAGRAAYKAAVAEKLRLLRSMLEALTEDEREIFMVLFRKIARAGRSQVQKKRSPA
jgi:DNA-binding MarR family transcriptional regulator